MKFFIFVSSMLMTGGLYILFVYLGLNGYISAGLAGSLGWAIGQIIRKRMTS